MPKRKGAAESKPAEVIEIGSSDEDDAVVEETSKRRSTRIAKPPEGAPQAQQRGEQPRVEHLAPLPAWEPYKERPSPASEQHQVDVSNCREYPAAPDPN